MKRWVFATLILFVSTTAAAETPSVKGHERSPDPSEAQETTLSNPTSSRNASQAHSLNTAGWTLLAVGGGTLAASLISGTILLTRRDDSEDKTGTDRLTTATNILAATGAATMVTGIVLSIVAERKKKKRAVSYTFLPQIASGEVGVGISGAF